MYVRPALSITQWSGIEWRRKSEGVILRFLQCYGLLFLLETGRGPRGGSRTLHCCKREHWGVLWGASFDRKDH